MFKFGGAEPTTAARGNEAGSNSLMLSLLNTKNSSNHRIK